MAEKRPLDEFESEYEPVEAKDLDSPIGILSALPEEEAAFADSFREIEAGERNGFSIRHGSIDNKPIVLVRTGLGKVNAALATMMLIQDFYCRAVIMAGVAGSLSPDIGIGDVVVADRVVQHDYGATIDGHIKAYQPGAMPLPGHEGPIGYTPPADLLDLLKRGTRGVDLPPLSRELTGGEYRMPKVCMGTIASGDSFINCARTRDRLYHEFGAVAVEMEGGAVAQVATQFKKPWVVVRGMSDLAGSASHVNFPIFAKDVSVAVAHVVRRLVGVI
jgi:adenosylhomocysteine nucleosidase